ncbi:MAG TPA: fumarylacetoacetate hydrolase family protein [Corynebacteriales bacterium]|nr:fumarylacetoacetate hydrolase family protein [Mycobacteriales bacterium]
MRIARFATPEGVSFGIVEGDPDDPQECKLRQVDELPWDGQPVFTGKEYSLAEARLLAPIFPTKIVAIGQNYIDHAAEMKSATTDEPLIFIKPPTTVIGPGAAIRRPQESERVDHEGELAVVINQPCRNVDAMDARKYILGYTIANDVTARDIQAREGQWTRAKSYDTFCPLGPWIETQLDPSDQDLLVEVTHPDGSSEVRQDSNTAAVVHTVSEIIEFVTSIMTLLPGDIILTGTPGGIGPLEEGDRVAVTIEEIGTLENPVENA